MMPQPILITDQDDEARQALAGALRNDGFETVELSTGEAAMAHGRRHRPALAIVEVLLPRTSGYEVCRALKICHGGSLPVVLMSARRKHPADRVAGLLIGADDYLVKPIHPDELRARVRRLLAIVRPVPRQAPGQLTTRERQVMQLMTEGLAHQEIAVRLVITRRTVAKHVEHILAKLGVHTRAQAVALALREGMVDEARGRVTMPGPTTS